jgi:hypothetical protein
MTTDTIAEMTQEEFRELLETVVESTVERKLLEILGDPDEGLEIRSEVKERLLRQRQGVLAGQQGRRLEDVVRDLGLD